MKMYMYELFILQILSILRPSDMFQEFLDQINTQNTFTFRTKKNMHFSN